MKKVYSLAEFGVKKHEFTLNNGLKVIFIEKPFAPIYASIIMGAGSVFNPSDNGLAHLTEHLLMLGPSLSRENFFSIMKPIGGFQNAFTGMDMMVVVGEIADNTHLPYMKQYFSEALGGIYMTTESLRKEKEIVYSEIQGRKSDNLYTVQMSLYKILAQGTAWGYTPLGEAEEMKAITIDEATNFFSNYCVVENMVLVIAGGCTVSDVEKNFGDIPFLHGQKFELPTDPPQIVNGQKRIFIYSDTSETNIFLGFNGPEAYSRDMTILNFVLSTAHKGLDSRFYKTIRNDNALAYNLNYVSRGFNKNGYIGTRVGIPKENTNKAIEAILECYTNLLKEGMTELELKDDIKTRWFEEKRYMQTSASWVHEFNDCLYKKPDSAVGDFPDIYNFWETITPEEVKFVLEKYITLDNFHLYVNGQESGSKYF